MKVLQVVPRLPPTLEGVGGYAAALGRALAACGIDSRFLVGDPGWSRSGGLRGEDIDDRSASSLARQLAASGTAAVLLHYANYGYQRRGCPAWLVGGIARWRAAVPERRLVTMFHEVYASGPPWRSSFWLSPVQRRLAASLLRASDGVATSLELYGRILARWEPRRPVTVAPVFSTVGEPGRVPAAAERRPRTMLVFGSAGIRRRAYADLRQALAAACLALEVTEILDVGPTLPALPEQVGGFPVRALGPLPDAEVSSVLLGSYAGFLGYPPPFLAKSTIFAAYCAHGLVPVCAWPPDGKRHSMAANAPPPCWEPYREPAPSDTDGLAAQARSWYGGHSLALQATAFRELFAGLGNAPPREPAAPAPSTRGDAGRGMGGTARQRPAAGGS
jgi:hypothetical protein